MQINHIIQFQELLSISINHGYYYNNRCNDFSFEVESETWQTLNQYGIILKQEPSKLILILDANKDFHHHCYFGELNLCFKIKNKNPQFLNFTELPFISNLSINFKQILGRELLHPSENVTFDICNESDLSGGIMGTINLSLNKENELFGLSTKDKNKILPIRHTINFRERNVFWKYIIYGTSKYIEEINNLYIHDKNQKDSIAFTKAIPIKLSSGKEGFLFISEKCLPLKERPNKQLGLYLIRNKNTENQLIKSLPCPNPRSVNYDINTENYYVQEFIYI
jgi:hypothetical protein